eukprot:4368412-Alexandrium_andersonii.AAC.1
MSQWPPQVVSALSVLLEDPAQASLAEHLRGKRDSGSVTAFVFAAKLAAKRLREQAVAADASAATAKRAAFRAKLQGPKLSLIHI